MENGSTNWEALSQKAGVSITTLRSRVEEGMSVSEAVNLGDRRSVNKTRVKHEWQGYRGAAEIADAIGVTRTTIFNHLKACDGNINKAVERAIEKSKKKRVDTPDEATKERLKLLLYSEW